jgi:hypothetical protein
MEVRQLSDEEKTYRSDNPDLEDMLLETAKRLRDGYRIKPDTPINRASPDVDPMWFADKGESRQPPEGRGASPFAGQSGGFEYESRPRKIQPVDDEVE